MDRVATPLGRILLVTDGRSLCALEFEECRDRMMRGLRARYGDVPLAHANDPQGFSSRLRDYFAGRTEAIRDLEVEMRGTPFERRVWTALRAIPAGETRSYARLAADLGRASAWRAVGRANACNPVAIVIPCHRLVGAHGALTGYAAGLARKRWLLRHEALSARGALPAGSPAASP